MILVMYSASSAAVFVPALQIMLMGKAAAIPTAEREKIVRAEDCACGCCHRAHSASTPV